MSDSYKLVLAGGFSGIAEAVSVQPFGIYLLSHTFVLIFNYTLHWYEYTQIS
jgi:hypothetical protein